MPVGLAIRTTILFLLAVTLLEITYLVMSESGPIVTVAENTAQMTYIILSILGESVRVEGISLYSPTLNMKIVSECTAITPTIVFASAVITFPVSASVKFKGILVGVTALYLINLVRVVSLYYIGTHSPDQMEFAHVVVWQTAMVLIAIGLWFLWVTRYSEYSRT